MFIDMSLHVHPSLGGSIHTANRLLYFLPLLPGIPQKPQIFGHEQPIDEEKIARLTCRSSGSKPAAQLRWKKGNKELTGGCPSSGALPQGTEVAGEHHGGRWDTRGCRFAQCLTTLASYATANRGMGSGCLLLNMHVSLMPLLGYCVHQL